MSFRKISDRNSQGVPYIYNSASDAKIVLLENDSFFSSVGLLMHMDGTNGSTVFADVKGKTITRNGSVQISTLQSKFGGASALFDGNGDFLSIPSSSDISPESTDFTWECWIRPTANINSGTSVAILGNAVGGSTGNAGLFLCLVNSKVVFRHWVNGSGWATSSQTISANDWYHIAGTKIGTTLQVFVDGVKGTVGSTTLEVQNNGFTIGSVPGNSGFALDYTGFIDEVRLTKPIVRYSDNFTPSVVPFPNL